jgi:hypothetical protein
MSLLYKAARRVANACQRSSTTKPSGGLLEQFVFFKANGIVTIREQ